MSAIIADLRRARIEQGLTQHDIAEVVGVHRTAVAAWERGRVEMTASHMEAYAAALGLQIATQPAPAANRRAAVEAVMAEYAAFLRKRVRR